MPANDTMIEIDEARVRRGLMAAAGKALFDCRVRACRRTGNCPAWDGNATRLEELPPCHRGHVEPEVDEGTAEMLVLGITIFGDFRRQGLDGPVVRDADPDLREAALEAVRLCLPKRLWPAYGRWQRALRARLQEAARCPSPAAGPLDPRRGPPAMSTAAKASAISPGPTPGFVASEESSWR